MTNLFLQLPGLIHLRFICNSLENHPQFIVVCSHKIVVDLTGEVTATKGKTGGWDLRARAGSSLNSGESGEQYEG